MNTIPCAVKGCPEVFQTEEGVTSSARFVCKNHPRHVQVSIVGRTFDPVQDTLDADVHFQDSQFSTDINPRPVRPIDPIGHTSDEGVRWTEKTPTLDRAA